MLKMHCSYAYILAASLGVSLAGCSSMVQQAAPVESAAASRPAQPAPAPQAAAAQPSGATVATPYQSHGNLQAKPLGDSQPSPGEQTYVVKPGDNLFRISLNHGLKYKDVAAWNNLPDTGIKVGQVLRLTPPGSDSTPAATETAPAAKPAQAAAASGAPANTGGAATVKTYPKALKLPYGSDAAKDLAAQSEGRQNHNNAQTQSPAAETVAPAPAKKQEASAAQPAAPSSKPAASEPAKQEEDAVAWNWPTEGKVIKGYSDSNKGIEISGRMGQPVLAAGEGKVVYSGAGLRGYGKLIIIKHNKTFLSAYAHNSQLLVKEGQTVKKGQKIAEMGNTDADQVKLHFEIRRFGKPVDPMQYLEHKS
ncbi:peptidoglycan DD-metalloendopeptidase family protein [Chromobacterium sp. IIBBL 290-4]|uniref:peptidoglycan DD-metalloendopeptidase family protein n=1 Tax=Chromobacterium sp. IIBBL 290-4 TaxID=2953890 RepID=UPI0020B7F5ED|nr:peptidoglycan DD-metalloendopeptidase family protein [Chromobacterium sp. IIBBL 290-4]UTH72413.1 peptidoglycan DD-metalloendopeptidase family protein [Chromobacterium sp. IIBBL 290-4]